MRKIRKAVFPVAGLGTRFLPATKAMPKEMLPVVDRPLIQYAVDEAREAGIEQMIFVTGRGKSAIEDHFDIAFELERTMSDRGKDLSVLSRPGWVRAIAPMSANKSPWGWGTPSGARATLSGMNRSPSSCPMNSWWGLPAA